MIKELLTGCTWREELFHWPWLLILPDHSKSIMYVPNTKKKKVKKRPYPNLKSAAPPQLNRQGSSQVSIQEDGDQGYHKQQLETISSSWRQGKYGSTVQSDGLAMIWRARSRKGSVSGWVCVSNEVQFDTFMSCTNWGTYYLIPGGLGNCTSHFWNTSVQNQE